MPSKFRPKQRKHRYNESKNDSKQENIYIPDSGIDKIIQEAMESLTPEEREKYKKLGESLYNSVDFKDNKILNNLPPPMEESLAYLHEGLKSGLHPTDLDINELMLLKEAYNGNDIEWLSMYGYDESDLPDIRNKINEL